MDALRTGSGNVQDNLNQSGRHLQHLFQRSADIDTLLLACTHYPLLMDKIKKMAPAQVTILSQGEIVAQRLKDYLERHSDMANLISKQGLRSFYTTDSVTDFDNHARIFFGEPLSSEHVEIF